MGTRVVGRVAGFVGVLAGVSPAMAQCDPWTVVTSDGPTPRQNHAMVFDGSAVMLFGGYRGGFGFNAETWLWNGLAWAQSPAVGPSVRGNFAMDLDTTRQRVVLFAGATTGGAFVGETWAWNGAAGSWTNLSPPLEPSARYNHAMAYDAQSDRMVLFGGWDGVRQNDTWLFDGTTWAQASPATVPGARSSHAMVYDSARDRVVMFGGFLGGGQWSNQTWEWNGTDWTLSPAVGPAGRQYTGMVYDSDRAVTVLSCGQAAGFVRLDDTWEYDGVSWTQASVGHPAPPRDQHAMAFVPAGAVGGGGTLLHGGYAGGANVLSDTWRLRCGAGCYADCNADGALTVADFGCFQTRFVGADPYADCNGDSALTVADFGCFQTKFVAGCP